MTQDNLIDVLKRYDAALRENGAKVLFIFGSRARGAETLRVISVEDLIADRMAQALAGKPFRNDMQNQAVRLYQLAEGIDSDYLDRRIRTETGGAASLEGRVHD